MFLSFIGKLYIGTCLILEDSPLWKVVIYVSSVALAGNLYVEVAIKCSLHNFLYFSLLISDSKARGLRSIITPVMATLTEFFYADALTNVQP